MKSQRSKHIDNRCFFIAKEQKIGNTKVVYCPADEMEGHCHAKPLQGSKFVKHRTASMNLPPKDATSKQEGSTATKKAVAFGQVTVHAIPQLKKCRR